MTHDDRLPAAPATPTLTEAEVRDVVRKAIEEVVGAVKQPDPENSSHPPVVDLVMRDLWARKAIGAQKYATPLRPFNGRDAMLDAYQEALDLAIYLRQAIAEKEMN